MDYIPYTRHCYIIEMLKQMETATWQCYQSHRCQCVTQHHSSWPSVDRWQSSTMRSKRPLDSLLRRCGFVSSFVVSCVVLQIYWLIPQRPSVTSTLTSTPPAMTPTATMKTTRSKTKMPCDHERALCASRLCGLKASLLVIFFGFDTPQHS